MRIKSRSTTVASSAPTGPEQPSGFPNIEAKPKKPVDMDAGLFSDYSDDPVSIRRLGFVAESCGENLSDTPLNVADLIKFVRTPYEPHNATERRYRNRVRNRNTAIVAKCVDCAGTRKAVTECMDVVCPLWPFRLGKNPYRGK